MRRGNVRSVIAMTMRRQGVTFLFLLLTGSGLGEREGLPGEQLAQFLDGVLAVTSGTIGASKEIPRIALSKNWSLLSWHFQVEGAHIQGPTVLERDGSSPPEGIQSDFGTAEIWTRVNLGLVIADYPKIEGGLWRWTGSGKLRLTFRQPSARLVIRINRNILSKCHVTAALEQASAEEVTLGSGGHGGSWTNLVLQFISSLLPNRLLSYLLLRQHVFPLLQPELSAAVVKAASDIVCNQNYPPQRFQQ